MMKTIIISFIAGFLSGLATPWVKWKVEKERLRREERKDLIRKAKEFIGSFDFEEDNFGDTTMYSDLRPYLKKETISAVEFPPPGLVVSARGDQVLKHRLLDDLARLEKERSNL